MRHLLCFVINAICIHTISALNCSAINSYVLISADTETILSAQALWPPYTYSVPPTELVKLSASDNICSGLISTDITNKIVLIMPENANGDCDYITRAFNAEQNNAKAVLIVDDEQSSGVVEAMPNTNPNLETTIPTRMIPYNAAQELSNALETDTVEIEFGCSETETPLVLCFVDFSGRHWWMDGDYQLQVNMWGNDHPVWKKDGYMLVLDASLYLFLHNEAQQNSWKWVITEDPTFQDDSLIVGKCSVGGVGSPINCPSWFTADTSGTESDEKTFTLNENIKINGSLCEQTDNYICIESARSALGGLHGTYRQFNALVPYWFREWNDCDTKPGYLTFVNNGESGVFWLIEPFDFWVVAECEIIGYSPKEFDEYVAFHPEICRNWKTLVDGSMDAKHKLLDGTMSVTNDKCGYYPCSNDKYVPNEVCMTRNGIMHSFLEGQYRRSGVRGRKWNTSEWIRSNKLYYNGDYVPVYLWYYGEISDSYNWWVIAMSNLSTAMATNRSSVYGYCESNTLSPTNCNACWNFYFSGEDRADGAWHSDCTFDLERDQYKDNTCGIEDRFDGTVVNWPQYLCIKDVLKITSNESYSYAGDVDFNLLIGAYEIDYERSGLEGIPLWVKPENDLIENETYIFYDKFYGYWQIGHNFSNIEGATLFCMEDFNEYLPTECDSWYDTKSTKLGKLFLYSEGCDASDVLRKTVSAKKKGNKTVIIAVLVVLAVVACCVAGFFYYKNQKQKRGLGGFERPTRGGIGSGSVGGDIELGDDVDTNLTTQTQIGGFDMSPLNVEGDDDDDLTIDAQQHDVVDDGSENDDEEHLITGNGTTKDKDSDPDLRMPVSDEEDETNTLGRHENEPEMDSDKQTLK